MNKKLLSERDICTKFITPAITQAGWDEMTQIREEVSFTKGRIIVRGKLITRGKAKRADYILYFKPNIPLALIEAKDNNHSAGDGMQQGLEYAATLNIPFVFSSNGDGFVFHDRTGTSPATETNLALDHFPSPQELWARYRTWKQLAPEQEAIVLQDYHDDGSGKLPRYYQVNAVNAAIEAIAKGQDRILLVMATGTGKTYTAFQIIWRLWKAGRKKRILFLADRNILVDQTMVNDFRPFGPAMAKLSTGTKTIEKSDGSEVEVTTAIDRKRRIDTAYEIYLGLYQAITGPEEHQKLFRGVTNHFADPDFDGEPVQIYEAGADEPITPPDDVPPAADDDDPIPAEPAADEVVIDGQPPDITIPPGGEKRKKIYVDGVAAHIIAERVEYLDEDGKLVTESLRDFTKKALQNHFASLDDFLSRWTAAQRKQAIIEELAAEGLPLEPLAEEVGKDLDPFDLICHVAFDRPPLTRRERADNVRKRDVFTKYGPQTRAVLEALLQKYQDQGVINLDDRRILQVPPFDAMGTPLQLIKEFGTRTDFERAVRELQAALYETAA